MLLKARPDTKIHLRDMKCELGLLERADGSARVVQGTTSVLCAVYGPAEVKVSKELADRYVTAVIIRVAQPHRSQKVGKLRDPFNFASQSARSSRCFDNCSASK